MSFLTSVLFMSQIALGYIPSADFIIKKTVNNNGTGFYLISQEIVLQRGQDSLSVQEEWLIKDGQTMRLKVKAPAMYIIYQDHRKTWFEDGKIQRTSMPSGFFESFFHTRSSKTFYELLFSHRIIAPDIYKYRPKIYNLKKTEYPPNPYVKLKMVDDQIVFQLADPRHNSPKRPLLWISQEDFDPLKIRPSSGVEINAHNYQTFTGNLRFPRVRTYLWKNAKATARILSVNKVSRKRKKDLDLDSAKQHPTSPIANALLKEFYSQFR